MECNYKYLNLLAVTGYQVPVSGTEFSNCLQKIGHSAPGTGNRKLVTATDQPGQHVNLSTTFAAL